MQSKKKKKKKKRQRIWCTQGRFDALNCTQISTIHRQASSMSGLRKRYEYAMVTRCVRQGCGGGLAVSSGQKLSDGSVDDSGIRLALMPHGKRTIVNEWHWQVVVRKRERCGTAAD
jgi:hypothetical protein